MLNTSFQLRTIGSMLRERRRERKLTLGQISEITKIRAEYLKAIEEGNYDIFPSEVYLKGFLKNYAKFLEVNSDRAMAMYRREREYRKNEPVISMTEKIKDKGINLTITPGRIIALTLAVALLLAIFYIGSYIGRIFQEPEIKITTPLTLTAGEEDTLKTTDESILIEGEVEVGSTLLINGQEFQTNNFEKFAEEFDLESGINKFILVAESQFGRKAEITLNIFREADGTTPEVAGEITVEGSPTPSPTPAELSISGLFTIADREAYVELRLDDELVVGRVFEIGESFDFSNAKKVQIFSPRPDAVTVTIGDTEEQLESTSITWEIIAGEIVKN